MTTKQAAATVEPVRQRTQFSCMATSMMMCLKANGLDTTEDEVNRVMGARPMQGASWEQALACAQHYGMRSTMVVPATVRQLKTWTDQGIPVMIAWNPEGRPWSHASVVFDVDDDLAVSVADPNIPDPDETVRKMPKAEFYAKWYEKWPDYLVRRPALAVEREITEDGRQVVAKKQPQKVAPPKKDLNKIVVEAPTARNPVQHQLIQDRARGTGGSGVHRNRQKDVERGKAPEKHKMNWQDREAYADGEMADRIAVRYEASYDGNPDGKPIYPNEINHGYDQPLSGGTDVMKRLQNQLIHEQGNPDQIRETNPPVPNTKRAFDEAEYDACVAYLNENMVKFPKKSAWWLPAHNCAINMTLLGGINLWEFSALPMFAEKRAYFPEGEDPVLEPAGILLALDWQPHHKYRNETFPATQGVAEKLVNFARQHATVGETMKAELKWIESHFHIAIPPSVETQYVMQAAKIAVRRWGINRLKTPDTFVPLDGRKAVPMPSWGRPRMKAGMAASVASRYVRLYEK